MIDEFIELYKEQFTLADIILTKSGATRCKTNMRFAVNDLRDLGLVLSKDANNKRSWAPSVMGLVALLNIRFNIEIFRGKSEFKAFDSLLTLQNNKKLSSYFTYDPTLIDSINMFKQSGHLYTFLTHLNDESLKADKELLENIIQSYIDFVHEGLQITEDGIKITIDFKEKSAEFQKRLFSIEERNKPLHSRLFRHFRKASGNK